jgi:nucleotide-binding universal stress UspA family protein
MRIVIGIDSSQQDLSENEQPQHVFPPNNLTVSSEQDFATLRQTLHIFSPTDITFVHGVDLGRFEFPFGREAASPAEREQYEELRRSKLDAGRRLLEHAASLIPKDGPASHQVCDVQTPARLILETAKAVAADLIVTGTRGFGPVVETVLGSVSHRVLSHAAQPTLVIKGSPRPLGKVLVAVEGQEDALRIQSWLNAHPFKNPVEVCALTVPQALRFASSMEFAEKLVKTTASAIQRPSYSVTTKVATGEPGKVLVEQSKNFDLLVVGSHGRNKLERFLLGSVSHSVVHRATCSVLVIR